MDYNYLKTILKDILRFRQQRRETTHTGEKEKGALKRRGSLYRAFSGLTRHYKSGASGDDQDDQVILVNAVHGEGSDERYETLFLMASDEGGDFELVFFRRLDEQFNKVIKFYKVKVEEVMKEVEGLNEQMDTLIALRIMMENPGLSFDDESVDSILNWDTSSAERRASARMNSRATRPAPMAVIQEIELKGEQRLENLHVRATEEAQENNHKNIGGGKKNITYNYKAPPVEVLKNVKINIMPETPRSTLKGFLMDSKTDLTFSRKELRNVEEQMKAAFSEFYQKLRLLKSYSFLNLLAFSKITKKYDKITSRNASKTYLKMVDDSYIGSSDEISRVMERVETTFIKHFSNGNRRKGMKILRPQAKRERHRITFSLGFFSGCSVALIVAITVLIHARNIFKSPGRGQYMENMFPLYSLFGFIVLHMIMYSANIFFWRRYRVNYPFIFGFKQGTELGYREVFFLSAGLAVLSLAGVISNLDMEMDPKTQSFKALTELVPLGLVAVVILIMFCPFNIIYRSSRIFLLRCALHCICAPLYKVTLPDFFLADQFTSQVQALRSLQFYICYYGWGDFTKRMNKCNRSDIFNTFSFIVAVIPFWIRFLQCLRRWVEEKDAMHGYNALKSLSTIIAVAMRIAYDLNKGSTLKIMAAASSAIATIATTYWDIVIDWGLLQRNSRNRWLRDKLLVPHKAVYFVAMSVLGFYEVFFLHRTAVTAIVACLEILRRGIWNFFRLENEHLNNVGKFRAFKSVPLPFSYDH
nr:TPA_asm: hypothetical protein HUJ06_010180 [Nelumbo nucifera]